jgi:hypothetical protein
MNGLIECLQSTKSHGQQNIKNQLTAITQKVLVRRPIVLEKRKGNNETKNF